jgi:hypothetical protein
MPQVMVTHPIFANNFSKNFWWAVVSGGVFTAVVFIVLFSLLCLQAKTDAGGYDDEDGNFSIRNLVKSDELSRLLKESLADELEAQATAILSSKMNAKAAAANSGTTPSGNGIVSPPAGSGTAIPGAPDKKSKSSAKSKGGVIYEVPKEHTKSGKPCIGRTTNFDKRKYANKDGRNRKKAKILCRYGPGQGQNAEQREI